MDKRNSIEFMYLASSRCFFNMSFVLQDFKEFDSSIVNNLKSMVDILYKEVHKKFMEYSRLLTEKESRIPEIVGDRISKIFDPATMKTKRKFLTGL
jgi:hypothetical protein